MPLPVEALHVFLEDITDALEELHWIEAADRLRVQLVGTAGALFLTVQEKNHAELVSQMGIHISIVNKGIADSYEELYPDFVSGRIRSDEQLRVDIIVNKSSELGVGPNDLLFFRVDSFTDSFRLGEEPFESIMAKWDTEKKLNVYIPTEGTYTNPFLTVRPLAEFEGSSSQALEETEKLDADRIRSQRQDLAKLDWKYPIPNIYYFNDDFPDEQINLLFKKNLFVSCLAHFSNKIEDGKYQIKGGRSIELEIESDFYPIHQRTMFKLFVHAYDIKDVHAFEKVQITRDVFVNYLTEVSISNLDEQLPKIRKTAERHFTLYISDKIKKFLTETKDEIKEAHKYTIEIRGEADKVTSSTNASILGLLTSSLATILGMFNKTDRWILVFVFILHIVYFLLSYNLNRSQHLKRKADIKKTFETYRDEFVELEQREWDKIEDVYYNPAMIALGNALKRYKWVSFSLTSIMIVLSIAVILLPDKIIGGKSDSPVLDAESQKVVLANYPIQVKIDNTLWISDQKPVMQNYKIYIPLRSIFEKLGYTVTWDSKTQAVAIEKLSKLVELHPGYNFVKVQGKNIQVTDSPLYLNNNLMIPFKLLPEVFGLDAKWNGSTNTVEIVTDNP